MLFLFSVFWCWAIAEPFRGFAVFLQNFPVARSRLVGFSLSAARQGKIVPCYGAKISLPEDLDGDLPDILSHWQNSDFSANEPERLPSPNAVFSLTAGRIAAAGQTEKYFAWGWWTTRAGGDCSGSSWSSSERVMPISSARSNARSWRWSLRLGQAG